MIFDYAVQNRTVLVGQFSVKAVPEQAAELCAAVC